MLKQRALSATLWSGADLALRQALQFAVTVALARILTPADIGTVALLTLFTGIASVLMDGGFSAALIQRQDVDHVDESTVFWFNVGIGAILSLALCGAAPAIASFYGMPELKALTIVLASTVFIGAFGAVQTTLISKRVEFRTQLKISVLATLISGGAAVVLAWLGYGIWSLAARAVLMTSVSTSLLWVFNSWRPAWQFSMGSARRLFGFGGYHLASSLLDTIYGRFYTLLIGKLYGARELGFYSNADTTSLMLSGFPLTVLARVAFPMFSAAAQDKATMRRGMQLSIRGMMLINVPIMLGLAALAEPLVRALFGAQWAPAVPILRVLCLAGLLYPLHMINFHALMAQGHSRLVFRLELVKKSLGVAFAAIGAIYGVIGIAWSQVAFSVLCVAINARYTRRFIAYGASAQLRDFLPVVYVAAPMAGGLYAVDLVWQASPWAKLCILALLGALMYLTLVWVFRLDAVRDVAALVRRPLVANAEPSSPVEPSP